MRGDALASGGRSATFSVAPGLKVNEAEMKHDLTLLPMVKFIEKYMITEREYDLLQNSTGEEVSAFAEEMRQHAELVERQMQAEDNQEQKAATRECFLTPFVANGEVGRVIVVRDFPQMKKSQSQLLLPKSMRQTRTLLPTTGHIIKAAVFDLTERDVSEKYIGRRILFGQMSGTAICFKGYPNWIQLELSEILAIIDKEDAQLQDEELEPMV